MPDVNWLAVLLCGISSMALGAIWYSPMLFAKRWMAGARLSEADLAGANMALIYGTAFLLSLVAAFAFALFVGRGMPLEAAIVAGAATGLCFVAASFGISYLFERRTIAHWLINGGYHTLQFTLFGLILGLMP
jgi:hypothetical protein